MTLASRADIQRAMQEAVEVASRGAGARAQITQQSLPPIRLQVVKVASEVRSALGAGTARAPSMLGGAGLGLGCGWGGTLSGGAATLPG